MNKSLILSVSRKYLGLMLVVGSLLLIATSNTNVVAPTARDGSVVTFLTPKHPAGSNLSVSMDNNDVSSTTLDNTPVTNTQSSVNATTNSSSTDPGNVPPATQNDASSTPPSPPSEVYVPPANDNPGWYTPPPHTGCGSCRPTYNKTGPQMMCPQYMACTY